MSPKNTKRYKDERDNTRYRTHTYQTIMLDWGEAWCTREYSKEKSQLFNRLRAKERGHVEDREKGSAVPISAGTDNREDFYFTSCQTDPQRKMLTEMKDQKGRDVVKGGKKSRETGR